MRLPSPSISRSSRWSTAACAHHEPCTARLFARTRTHARPCAPPRLALAVHRRLPPIPRRDIRSDFVSEPHRRLGEAESWLELGKWALVGGTKETRPRQVWSHRAPGLAPFTHALSPFLCAPPAMPSHSTLHPRPGVGSLGAHVGRLSSRCDAAALGADQAGHLRPRRYDYSLTLPSASTLDATPQALLRPRASPQAPPTPVHKLPWPTEMPLEPPAPAWP